MWVEPRPPGRRAPEPGARGPGTGALQNIVFLFMFENSEALDEAGVQNVNANTVPCPLVVSYCKTGGHFIATQFSLFNYLFFV